jgi:putative endonuclease
MAYYVYILYSESLAKHYVGCSKFHSKRLRQHLRGQSHWTKQAKDWKEVFCQTTTSRSEAFGLERKIKKRGAERFLTDLQLLT